MRSGIVHYKSDHKSCVIPTADRNTAPNKWQQKYGQTWSGLDFTKTKFDANVVCGHCNLVKNQELSHLKLLMISVFPTILATVLSIDSI